MAAYPRRLIEVDLPIGQISDAARDGRSVHHGHITAIHIWWARKPLPSCRAATLAAALLDPADDLCPPSFKTATREALRELYGVGAGFGDGDALRRGLIRLVSEFATWRFARSAGHLEAAQQLVRAAHESCFGIGTPPLVADPFSGGGSIPLEALRLGASAYASDLNPVAALISRVTLEYVQRHGERLLDAVERQAAEIGRRLRDDLGPFYPGRAAEVPLAWLWFRTIRCEAPGCGAAVVLTSKFQLARAGSRSVGLRVGGWHGLSPILQVKEGPSDSFPQPTVRRGAATCLRCGFTMPVERVREQLTAMRGGAADAQLVAVATDGSGGRAFREPDRRDLDAVRAAAAELERRERHEQTGLPLLPGEPLPPIGTLGFRVQRYGMRRWRDVYTPRQLLTISTLARLVRDILPEERGAQSLGTAVRACLALAVDRLCDYQNTGCSWNPSSGNLPHLFTRQALPIIWDFGEANPLGGSSGDWGGAVEHVVRGLRNALVTNHPADVGRASASHQPLPTDCAHLVVTDPPYYDAIPYADLSDFFYVWLRRMLHADHPELFGGDLVPRDDECIVNTAAGKDRAYYRRVMSAALAETRRVTRPDGVGVIIFAHKSTAGWEDLLAAMLEAGWIITASWPIDTENASRLRARNSAVLASSVHLVCRPRERPDGTLIDDTVGNWRDVLAELPGRIHEWMPRLAREGVVGADAIFACLGPALEIFSRYARVEKASGEPVPLKEYLEQVWAAVAKEALGMIFEGADATGFEEDARLTAMWLWTLSPGAGAAVPAADEAEGDDDPAGEDDTDASGAARSGFALEYDAARKIAQGLGANLEDLRALVEVKGDTATLLPVSARARLLFARSEEPAAAAKKKGKKKQLVLTFDAVIEDAEEKGAWGADGKPDAGSTVLDRVHQAMLLFAANRSDALKRFIAEDGAGKDERFWRLAQALSALYPAKSEEKRWVDGVLARKRQLGF